MERIIERIIERGHYYEMLPADPDAREVGRKEFTLLLGGISACRRLPGIERHMGYEELYHCTKEQDIAAARENLKKYNGVVNRDSLMKACYQDFSTGYEYEEFMTFWKGAPMFDITELNEQGRDGFTRCSQFAEYFYPVVKEKGFYAWDINERIGLCRKAVACGIITEEEFWEITDTWVRIAEVFYHSYAEYAVSCLCGAIYYMNRFSDDDPQGFLDININVIDSLMNEGGAWRRNQWYEPKEREWVALFRDNLGSMGCIITKKALDAECVGYMYREEPMENMPDSGWRFFFGDEDDEYVNDAGNSSVCAVDTICNLNPDIMAYMYAKIGSRFGRHVDGWQEE